MAKDPLYDQNRKTKNIQYDTISTRKSDQEPQDGFGQTGLYCHICHEGPCRVDPFGNRTQKGICGASGDLMVARNWLRTIAGGAAIWLESVRSNISDIDTIISENNTFTLADSGSIKELAHKLKLKVKTEHPKALEQIMNKISSLVLNIYQSNNQNLIRSMVEEDLWKLWKTKNIIPTSLPSEIIQSFNQSSMAGNSDHKNLIQQSLRTSIATGLLGIQITTALQNALIDSVEYHPVKINHEVLDPHAINILVLGDSPLLTMKLLEEKKKRITKQKDQHAKAINILGLWGTGLDHLVQKGLQLIAPISEIEEILTSRLITLLVLDKQFILPSLIDISNMFPVEIVTTRDNYQLPNAHHIPLPIPQAEQVANEIIERAITRFNIRSKQISKKSRQISWMVDFPLTSPKGIKKALSNINPKSPYQPIAEKISSGDILGIVGVIGGTTLHSKDQYFHGKLISQLLQEDILVIGTGNYMNTPNMKKLNVLSTKSLIPCGPGLIRTLKEWRRIPKAKAIHQPIWNFGGWTGSCDVINTLIQISKALGLSPAKAPVIISAQEYRYEPTIVMGLWAVTEGIPCHINSIPPIIGSRSITDYLTRGIKDELGGYLIIERGLQESIKAIMKTLQERRSFLSYR